MGRWLPMARLFRPFAGLEPQDALSQTNLGPEQAVAPFLVAISLEGRPTLDRPERALGARLGPGLACMQMTM